MHKEKVEITNIEDKSKSLWTLKKKRPANAPMRRCDLMKDIHVKRRRGEPKRTWMKAIKQVSHV